MITLRTPIAERASCYRESRATASLETPENSPDDQSGLIFRDWYDYLGHEVPQYTLAVGILHVSDSYYGIVESSDWIRKVKARQDRYADSPGIEYKSEIRRLNRTEWVCLTTISSVGHGGVFEIDEEYRLRLKADFYLSVVARYMRHPGNESILAKRQRITRHLLESIIVDRVTGGNGK